MKSFWCTIRLEFHNKGVVTGKRRNLSSPNKNPIMVRESRRSKILRLLKSHGTLGESKFYHRLEKRVGKGVLEA